jgi:hypothetical protein
MINNKTGELWGQYSEVIRNNNEYNSYSQPDTVFPEIFIKGFEMFQNENLYKNTEAR